MVKLQLEMKECFVLIEPLNMKHTVEENAMSLTRRSKRLLMMKERERQLHQRQTRTTDNKTPKKNTKVSRTIKKRVSQSVVKPVKSILKVSAMRSRSKSISTDQVTNAVGTLRGRSKSVSFDPVIGEDNSNVSTLPWVPRSVDYNRSRSKLILSDAGNAAPIKSARRQLFGFQHVLETEVMQPMPDTPRNNDESNIEVQNDIEDQSVGGPQVQNDLAVAHYVDVHTEDSTPDLEARIEALVESNRIKINRIKELVTEKAILLKDKDALHNMNLFMAKTIDEIREDNTLEDEIGMLRQRIDTINRENFDLKKQNQRIKAILSTYSAKFLAEHGYSKLI